MIVWLMTVYKAHVNADCRLQKQLFDLRKKLGSHKEEHAGLLERISVLEEAEKALGRGGIPSFVLESVLGELQDR